VGRVCFWNGGSVWIGRQSGKAGRHAHHAVQLTLVFDGTVAFRVGSGAWREVAAAIVAPDRPHEFDGHGRTVAQIFVEPESIAGRALAARAAEVIAPVEDAERARAMIPLREAFEGGAPEGAVAAAARQAIAVIARAPTLPEAIDPRVRAVLDRIRSTPGDAFTLPGVAAASALSPGRFRHLFVAQVGTSFRAFLLWARINHAIRLAMEGASWTHAAHEAGFADSSHLTRTFRRMFGVAPRMLVQEPSAAARGA
jgi:AraC-like DNA-binding protein